MLLKQSTAVNLTVLIVGSSDHITGLTGATLVIYASKAAGAPALITPTVTELDSTHTPGLYKLALTTTHTNTLGELQLHVTAGSADPTDVSHQVIAIDLEDTVRAGLTALPNAAASAIGGLPLAVDTSGRVDVLKVNGTSQTARDIGASVLLSSGTGTGQLDFTSGVVKANLVQILATALTETSGQIAGAFKKFFNVAAPVRTCLGVDQTGDSFARLGAPVGASISADIAAGASPSTISAAVVDQALSGHTTAGTVGAALQSAGSAGDPWATTLPGAYGAGTAGKIVGDNVNATISSRLAASGYTAPDNADILLIKAKTDNIPASPAAVSDIPTANANADALLDRAAGVETGRTLRQSLRLMLAAMAGKISGAATTTVVIRDSNDTKNRITATVDADGNRTAVTYDVT